MILWIKDIVRIANNIVKKHVQYGTILRAKRYNIQPTILLNLLLLFECNIVGTITYKPTIRNNKNIIVT
jgi:hypothetical protein